VSSLPLDLDYAPMEALVAADIPDEEGWEYEPKWDGFRCLAFRSGDFVELRSKKGQPLGRYFPEIVEALLSLKAERFVLDSEIVVPLGDTLSFDNLLMRIHPAESRIKLLSKQTPAMMLVFDLLVDDHSKLLTGLPLEERKHRLDRFADKYLSANKQIVVSPYTTKLAIANKWLGLAGKGLDGIIAKRTNLPYKSGERTGMVKVKLMRTADCVIGGFRYGTNSKLVGSLLLGLYDDEGLLNHCGFTSSFTAAEREKITEKIKPYVGPPGFTGSAPGGPSRWSTERSMQWVPLRPELVVEVRFDHFSGGRFRHGTKLLRWRPDKDPRTCKYDQLEVKGKSALKQLLV
jgi:ATP-dependent DNA ligase